MQLVDEIILLNKILKNHLLSEHLEWNYASFNIKISRQHQLVSIKLSNCRNTLYVATHLMSFLSLKHSLVYLMYDHGVLRDVFFGSRQLSAKILPTLGYKPNPSIPIIFDRFSLKCLKIAWLPGKTKNTVSLRFIFFENYPYVALTCSSLLISSSQHFWELRFFVARFLRSQNWDQVPC